MSPKFFPTLLIALDVAAALVYWTHGDARKVVYWMAAAALTTVVTWMAAAALTTVVTW